MLYIDILLYLTLHILYLIQSVWATRLIVLLWFHTGRGRSVSVQFWGKTAVSALYGSVVDQHWNQCGRPMMTRSLTAVCLLDANSMDGQVTAHCWERSD